MTCSAHGCRKHLYAQQHGFHPFGKNLEWVFPRRRSRRLPDLIIHGDSHAFCCQLWVGSFCERVLLPSRVLGGNSWNQNGFALAHWHQTMSRAYESSFLPCNGRAALKPQHHVDVSQPLNAKFISSAKSWLCCRCRKENSKEGAVYGRGLREHPWTQGVNYLSCLLPVSLGNAAIPLA